MFLAFRNTDDIRKRYKGFTSRNLDERLFRVYSFARQPRPHISLDIYVSRRALLIQDVDPTAYLMERKMTTLRKERYNALRTSIPEMWRLR